jgi:hypothetical protein
LLTPGDIAPDADGKVRWWRPGVGEIARHMGRGWWYLVPLLGLLVLSIGAVATGLIGVIFAWGFKLWALLLGAAIASAGKAVSLATRARKEPFCIHCGYTLTGLPDHHLCPECGRPYSFNLIQQYQEDPAWFIQRWKSQRLGPPESPAIAAGPNRVASKDGT